MSNYSILEEEETKYYYTTRGSGSFFVTTLYVVIINIITIVDYAYTPIVYARKATTERVTGISNSAPNSVILPTGNNASLQ